MDPILEFAQRFDARAPNGVVKIAHSYFSVTKEQEALINNSKNSSGFMPRYVGIFLGSETKGKFYPSVALVDIVGKQSPLWIEVDKNAEWLFLCGRDIFGKSIVKYSVDKGWVIVKNSAGEILGFGKVVNVFSKHDKVAVKNTLDKGDFLRRER